jgi:hypothetical protein
MKIYLLRVVHGVFALYFLACLGYLYYAAFSARFDLLLVAALVSLAIEGFVVFILNKGDCPLIYVQRKVGDDTPFFELFLPPRIAKLAIPFFGGLTWLAVALLSIRAVFH